MQIALVVSGIILGGVLGGIASYFATEISKEETKPLIRRIVLGVAAATVVPLFLNMISSSILSGSMEWSDYLVFLGFCVVAGFSSKSFLSSVSKKLIEKVDAIEERQTDLEEEIDPIVAKETEPGQDDDVETTSIEIGEEERAILSALNSPQYSRRYIRGIQKDTGFEDIRVVYHLLALRDKGLVQQNSGKSKDLFWLTSLGRRYCNKNAI